jgi:hypothetical protein
MARRMLVLFRPVAAAAAPRLYDMPIPGEAARYSGMMPPTHSEMMSPTVPR